MQIGRRALSLGIVVLLAMSFAGCICVIAPDNKSAFEFDETTGAYVFEDCGTGVSLEGIGMLTKKGSSYSLKDVQSDRVVVVTVDLSTHKGTASVKTFNPNRTFAIGSKTVTQSPKGCELPCAECRAN
jgi:hypothetical protein